MTPSRDQSRSSLRSYATPLLSRLVPIIVLALGVSVALHESIALPQAVRRLPFELVDHILIRSRINGQHDALLLYDPIQGLMLDADYVRRNAIPTFTGPELGMGIVRAGGAGAKEYDVSFA